MKFPPENPRKPGNMNPPPGQTVKAAVCPIRFCTTFNLIIVCFEMKLCTVVSETVPSYTLYGLQATWSVATVIISSRQLQQASL